MQKHFKPLLIVSIAIVIVLTALGFQNQPVKERQAGQSSADFNADKVIELSDLQIKACNSAQEGGTCQTRLRELAFVSPEDCCTVLGLCC